MGNHTTFPVSNSTMACVMTLGEEFFNAFDAILLENSLEMTPSLKAFRDTWKERIDQRIPDVNITATNMGGAMKEGIKAFGSVFQTISSKLNPADVEVLKSRISKLEKAVEALMEENAKLKADLAALNHNPGKAKVLVAREGVRLLENCVVLDIMQTKSQMKKKKIYDMQDLVDNGFQSQLNAIAPLEMQKSIKFYKKQGDSFHDVKYTKEEFFESLLDEEDDEEDIQTARDIANMLEHLCLKHQKAFVFSPEGSAIGLVYPSLEAPPETHALCTRERIADIQIIIKTIKSLHESIDSSSDGDVVKQLKEDRKKATQILAAMFKRLND